MRPWAATLPLLLILLPAAEAAEVTVVCAPGEERTVIVADEDGGAAAACKSDGALWPWVAGGAALASFSFGWAWLAWLRWLPAVGLFTRLRDDRLLEHPLRAQIVEIVEAEPGIHYQAIAQRTGRGKGSVSHHLAVLVRGGLLASVHRPGHRSFFRKGRIDAPIMRGLACVKSATAAELLRTVAQRPGIQKRALARELGCRESAVRYHIRRFEEAGLLADEEGTRLTPLGEAVLDLLPETVAAPQRPPGLPA